MKKDIFNGKYTIDSDGNIFNNQLNRYISYYITNKGYKAVDLYYEGKRYKWLVHRLVAESFIPNPENHPIVLHLDSVRTNCNVNNLKWGTYSENNKQAVAEGSMKVPRPYNRKYYILYDDTIIMKFYGLKSIIKETGLTESMLRNYIFRNQSILHGNYAGFKIKLLEDTFNDHLLTGE